MTLPVLLLIILAVIVLLGVGISLVIGRGRSELPPPSELDRVTEEVIEHPEHPDPHLEDEEPGAAADTIERPEPAQGRLVRLRARLSRSQNALGKSLLALLPRDARRRRLGRDRGHARHRRRRGRSGDEIVEDLRTKVKVLGSREPEAVRATKKLLGQVGTDMDRSLRTEPRRRARRHPRRRRQRHGQDHDVGKLARVLVADGKTVLLGAADTFRAAAADQLQTWGERVGARPCAARRAPTRRASPSRPSSRASPPATTCHRRHGRPAAHQDRPDGRARQGQAGHREAGARSTRCCSSSTPRPDRTA